ncbi:MAG: hypothetical protein ACYTHM_24570, partial [Planctomycetota bacterium]
EGLPRRMKGEGRREVGGGLDGAFLREEGALRGSSTAAAGGGSMSDDLRALAGLPHEYPHPTLLPFPLFLPNICSSERNIPRCRGPNPNEIPTKSQIPTINRVQSSWESTKKTVATI